MLIRFAGYHVGREDFPEHQHDTWELIYQRSGTVRTYQRQVVFEMDAGRVLLHPPGTPHHDEATEPYELIYLFLEGDLLRNCPTTFADDDAQTWLGVVSAIYREWQNPDAFQPEMLDAISRQLTVLLRRVAVPKAEVVAGVDARLLQVEAALRATFRSPVTLQEIARRLGVSRSWIHAEFHRAYRVTPHEFQERMRIDHALAMLRHSSLKIGFIGEECGYSSASHFTHAVRRATGLAPIEHRERARESQK